MIDSSYYHTRTSGGVARTLTKRSLADGEGDQIIHLLV